MFERLFKNRFFKASRQEEMEEVTDLILRSYLRNKEDTFDEEDITSGAHHLEARIEEAWENVCLYLPTFKRVLPLAKGEEDDVTVALKSGVVPSYVTALREIINRQIEEDDF